MLFFRVFMALALAAGAFSADAQSVPQSSTSSNTACRVLAVGDASANTDISLGCLDASGQFTGSARNVIIDPRQFGAGGAGATDDTAAMASAITLARSSGRPIGGTGVFRIDGTLDSAGVQFVARNAYSRESLSPASWGFVLQHNSVSGPLFAPASCSGGFDGVVFHDPRQTGSGSLPVVRPPLFRYASKCVDFTMQNSVVVNSYDVFHIPATGVSGDWRILNNRIYAIRFVFDIAGSVPEVIASANNMYSPGVFQGGAIGANSGMLSEWTSINGAWMRIDNDTLSVDGLKSSNDFVFGYRNWLRITSGRLDVSTVSSPSWDGLVQPIISSGNASLRLSIVGGHTYARSDGDPTLALPALAIGGAGLRNVSIVGHQMLYASGKALEITGTGAGVISWDGGEISNWAMAPGTSGAAVSIDAAAINLTLKPARIRPGRTDLTCVTVTNAATFDIATTFVYCGKALAIQDAPGLLTGRDTSIVVGTSGPLSYSNDAGARFVVLGAYDKP